MQHDGNLPTKLPRDHSPASETFTFHSPSRERNTARLHGNVSHLATFVPPIHLQVVFSPRRPFIFFSSFCKVGRLRVR